MSKTRRRGYGFSAARRKADVEGTLDNHRNPDGLPSPHKKIEEMHARALFPNTPSARIGFAKGIIAFAFLTFADTSAKFLGVNLAPYQIGLQLALVASVVLYMCRPNGEAWRDLMTLNRPWLVHARATTGLFTVSCAIYAFSTIKFAEATSLMFVSPIFVTLISVIFLGERVGPIRWLAVFASFMGVLLIVRPGFARVEPGHIAALAAGFFLGCSVILLRRISSSEKPSAILGTFMLYMLVANGLLTAFGSHVMPTIAQLAVSLIGGVYLDVGQVMLLSSTKSITASQVSLMHYSEIVWASLLGFVLFSEVIDAGTVVGILLIVGCGVTIVIRESRSRLESA